MYCTRMIWCLIDAAVVATPGKSGCAMPPHHPVGTPAPSPVCPLGWRERYYSVVVGADPEAYAPEPNVTETTQGAAPAAVD